MKKVLILMWFLIPMILFSQEKITQSSIGTADKYLNISNFKNAFKQNVGGATGNTVNVIVNDEFNKSDKGNPHGVEMANIIESVKVSNDVRVITKDVDNLAVDCSPAGNKGRRVKCELSSDVERLLKKGDVRVWNESNGWPVGAKIKQDIDLAIMTNQFKKLLKKYDVMYVVSSGNNEKATDNRNVKTLLNNPLDNLFTVAQFGIDPNSGKPVMQNGLFFKAPDFSVFGEYITVDSKETYTAYSGTSNAAAVTSAIVAQYYSIMPCWSTVDMKRFINATLKPVKDIELEDKWTKTKKYLSYSEKIFDKNFLRSHNIKVCGN